MPGPYFFINGKLSENSPCYTAVSDTHLDVYKRQLQYNEILVAACAAAGIAAFTGEGTNPKVMEGATAAIAASGGAGIPTVKPVSYTHLDVYKRQAPARPARAPPAVPDRTAMW